MRKGVRFPFVERDPSVGPTSSMPMLPIRLEWGRHSSTVIALLDTGSSMNVLPFSVGAALGLDWSSQQAPIKLTGNLAAHPARAVVLDAQVGESDMVQLAFAWSQSDAIPVILGQVNFFQEFDVCFYRALGVFDVAQR